MPKSDATVKRLTVKCLTAVNFYFVHTEVQELNEVTFELKLRNFKCGYWFDILICG